MFTELTTGAQPPLIIPEALQPRPDLTLPQLTRATLDTLQDSAWTTVGVIAAFIDTSGQVMLLEHDERDKNGPGAWGPLGETSKYNDPVIEQPIETLFRGIREELSVENPTALDLRIHRLGGWAINQWPIGDNHPGEYACGISIPVFVGDSARAHLESFDHGTEEISNLRFVPPDAIGEMSLRPGVEAWLAQLMGTDLLTLKPDSALQRLDFSNVYAASLRDIDLRET